MAATEANIKSYELRANLPRFAGYVALAAIAATIIILGASYYQGHTRSEFKLKSEHTHLSTDVVAEVNNYERLETDQGTAKYYIKADHAKTFSDNHQELQNLYLEVYGNNGETTKLTGQDALYVPEEDKNFTAYLKGEVNVDTPQGLKVKTSNVVYTKKTEVAQADEQVDFERGTIKGRSTGATIRVGDKQIDLLKDVEIESFETPELMRSGVRYAKLNSDSAMYDQLQNRIDLAGGFTAKIDGKGAAGVPQSVDAQATRAVVLFSGDQKPAGLKSLELTENVHITSTQAGQPPTTIDSGYALFEKDADRYQLRNGAHIVTAAQDKTTEIRGSEAVFEQAAHKVSVTGAGEISQGTDYVKGDAIFADLFDDNKLRHAVARGNAFAKHPTEERLLTIAAPELNLSYNDARVMSDANAVGQSRAEMTALQGSDRYSNVVMTAVKGIGVAFKSDGMVDAMRTDGRTTINLNVPNNTPDAANKRLTADTVKTTFQQNGKDIARAEAAGNAELFIEPLNTGKDIYKTSIDAPHFDCDFFPTGNNVHNCKAGQKAKVIRERTVPMDGRGTQYLSAADLNAGFADKTNDIDRLDAVGDARFTEVDKNATAKQMTFTQSDQVLRLRGGEPTAWDSRARGKAREIDLDTRNNKSYMRGGVATTFYSKAQMQDAGPFANSDKPVFITSETAEFDNSSRISVYTGNARAWQENNYVRGERMVIDQNAGTFRVDGGVQSVLYNARVRQGTKDATLPVSVAAASMLYSRDSRVVQYRQSVDVRQGTDRITAEAVDAFLDEHNTLTKTVAESNVVLTQPGRRGTGNWAQYTAADDVAVIRGEPATVSDAENGSSSGSQMTFSMRDHKVSTEGKPRPASSNTGRTRSVYKVKPE